MLMSAPQATAQMRASKRRAIIGASFGNFIEWFDFYIYSYTSIYFAALFFPKDDPTSQLLSTAGIFALGYFMRPVGGWLFGLIADRRGRRISMMISICIMSFGAFMIAIVPTYQIAGVLAPCLLLSARLLQGVAIGGEYGITATYLGEIASSGRRGLVGSFQYLTIILGQLIGLTSITVLQFLLSESELRAWGWRIPFLMGGIGALAVMYLRSTMEETSAPRADKDKEAGSIAALFAHKKAILIVLGLTFGTSLYYNTFTAYMQKYLIVTAGVSAPTANIVMAAALVCFMFAQPLGGLLADRIGIRNNMLLFSGLATVFVFPLLYAIKTVGNPVAIFGLVVVGLLIAASYTAIAGLVKAELFPKEIRALGVGLTYAIANAISGGTTEYVALSFQAAGVPDRFVIYIAGTVTITFLATLLMPDLRRYGYLSGSGEIEKKAGWGRNR
jgi:MHS family dicarboxylic acid transporter PcaT-like MFS transporter